MTSLTTQQHFFSISDFSMIESAPANHKFKLSVFQPNDPKNFIKFVRKEVKLLRNSLPQGIHVKGFEDRMVSLQRIDPSFFLTRYIAQNFFKRNLLRKKGLRRYSTKTVNENKTTSRTRSGVDISFKK